MTLQDPFRSSLDELPRNALFEESPSTLVERWELEGVGIEAVMPVLAFMEDHPLIEFGSPGPLAHFIERFHRRGYDEALFSSVRRCPTAHTVWLLNRLINGEGDETARKAQISMMREIATSPSGNQAARSIAADFSTRLDGQAARSSGGKF